MNDETVIQISAVDPLSVFGLTNKGNLAYFDHDLNKWVIKGTLSNPVDIYKANEEKKPKEEKEPIKMESEEPKKGEEEAPDIEIPVETPPEPKPEEPKPEEPKPEEPKPEEPEIDKALEDLKKSVELTEEEIAILDRGLV